MEGPRWWAILHYRQLQRYRHLHESHPVIVSRNGTTLYTSTVSAYGQEAKFSLTVALPAGDEVGFACQTGSTYTYLSTGLQATITRTS
jgi:hypothetical protein